ncbi:CLUMA_CG015510, isoform A [Clunio marinus]|uniref:CLUMA_CG015510, isoform A n=1 Tax=Clunio marinus TaxID=568069 RepID=A0A1J1IQW7_9DIPT|nr:CLUMA_CG015510, isoform A [Clunio marinus]
MCVKGNASSFPFPVFQNDACANGKSTKALYVMECKQNWDKKELVDARAFVSAFEILQNEFREISNFSELCEVLFHNFMNYQLLWK